jgi:hypothetical protein
VCKNTERLLISDAQVELLTRRAISNCVNLISVTWTRDGTLKSYLLETLSALPALRELEFNGHDAGQYDPALLLRFRRLEKLSVIMPSTAVAQSLVPWMQSSGHHLRHLTLICKSTNVITDDLMKSIVPSLVSLQQLHLTGCPRLTHQGVLPFLYGTQFGLEALSLEGLSRGFDMSIFSRRITADSLLTKLKSITLTLPHTAFSCWATDVVSMLTTSQLESFHVYGTSYSHETSTGDIDIFFKRIVDYHRFRLRRFSMHRLQASVEAISDICERCPSLMELFVVLNRTDVMSTATGLHLARQLRVLHINFFTSSVVHEAEDITDEEPSMGTGDPLVALPILPEADALKLVRRCSSWLRTFGCNTRVWKVESVVEGDPLSITRKLARYDSRDIPDQFLVVRTS